MRKTLALLSLALLTLSACGPKAGISETRMASAPAREPTCDLDLVSVDITAFSFNQEWEVLGYVTLSDHGVQDPNATENRELVRPRACAMGGTAVAVAVTGMEENRAGRKGSSIAYMVLRPKSNDTQAPTAF